MSGLPTPIDPPTPEPGLGFTVRVLPADLTDDHKARGVVPWIGEVRLAGFPVFAHPMLTHASLGGGYPSDYVTRQVTEHTLAAFAHRLRDLTNYDPDAAP
jgi:hypothetical protein